MAQRRFAVTLRRATVTISIKRTTFPSGGRRRMQAALASRTHSVAFPLGEIQASWSAPCTCSVVSGGPRELPQINLSGSQFSPSPVREDSSFDQWPLTLLRILRLKNIDQKERLHCHVFRILCSRSQDFMLGFT